MGRSTAAYLAFIAGNAFGQACNASGIVVDALTAQPVPHAQVTLQSRGAASDATGHWSIAGVPCGAARFTAERPGYLQSTSAALAPAPDMRLLLTPESSIEGKVFDETGDPIVGAEIQVYDSVVQQGRRVMRVSGAANTNGAGEFRMGGLSANKYRFCAHSSKLTWPVGGGDPLLYTESCYPAEQAIRIASGVELRQNFTLAAVKGVHVRGVVSGIPEGARVVIQLGHNTARIASGGKFDLDNVAAGTYTMEGLADVEGRSALATTRVEVGGANVDNVIPTFVRGVQVTGTILSSPEDSSPEDLSLTVNLVPSDPSWDAGKPEWDTSRRTFTFASVAPGKYGSRSRRSANLTT
jgi:Carboxypeptidase regulatory-like domain